MIRLLVTNDDGIDAPGLKALEEALQKNNEVEYWVVAPEAQRSACSHSMSLGKPVFLKKHDDRHYSHSGQVADGVYLALVELLDFVPDAVVSGINLGANLSEDVIYSGTVAGAREAAMRQIRGIALSLAQGENFEDCKDLAVLTIISLCRQKNMPMILNVNYPAGKVRGTKMAPLGKRPYELKVEKKQLKGQDGYFLGGPPLKNITFEPETDVDFINQGWATITPLAIDQTDYKGLEFLNTGFDLLL